MPYRVAGGLNKGDLVWRRPNRITLSNLYTTLFMQALMLTGVVLPIRVKRFLAALQRVER